MVESEKFSPAKELKALDKKRISYGMGALYPEIWEPVEEAEKEKILESSVKEISSALQEKDFPRAGGLMRSLRAHFEADVIERRMKSGEYIPQTPSGSEEEREIKGLFKEGAWDTAKERLERYKNERWVWGYLSYASEMRKFDPQRFDKEVEIADSLWQSGADKLKETNEYDWNYHVLESALALKGLDPKKFEDVIEIPERFWEEAKERVRRYFDGGSLDYAVYLCAQMYSVDRGRAESLVGEKVADNWDRIVEKLTDKLNYYPDYFSCHLASGMQRIKPEGKSSVTVTRETWERMKDNIRRKIEMNEDFVFDLANDLADVKVQK